MPTALDLQTEAIARYYDDPLGYVMFAFPWGVKGTILEAFSGPRAWQEEFLVVLASKLQDTSQRNRTIREAVSSGHGIGKGALSAMLILWALSTGVDTRVIVTANTEGQLKTKTWAEVAKWHRLSINRDWFTFTATSLFSRDESRAKNWRADMIPWSEHNPEAFAGLHNYGRRVLLIMDEASAIPDAIWEVCEGATTDESTEILWCVFGNPTRNRGRFRECFGSRRHRWGTWQIDARVVEGTNELQFAQWVDDYGEDSDFVRVRVRGMFPRASSLQLIGTDLVAGAMKRKAVSFIGDPLIMAVDVARGGGDSSVIAFRRGMDARSIPALIIPGYETRDSMRLVSKVVDLCSQYKPDAIFVDATGVGGPLADRVRQLGHVVTDVQFGSASPDGKYANLRAYMYMRLREALERGLAIESSVVLEADLTGIEYGHDKRDRLILESKERLRARGVASPDYGDALAMTYAYEVALSGVSGSYPLGQAEAMAEVDYDPFEEGRIWG
jgi:hypothetical protein